MRKLLSILTALAGCILVALSSYSLIDPTDVQMAIRETLKEEDASQWISAWQLSSVHFLVGGVLALFAAAAMWNGKRWSMIALLLTCVWLLLYSFVPAYRYGPPPFQNAVDVLEFTVLVFIALCSAIAFVKWHSHRPSPNKGFNRTPESSGPAKPGKFSGGAG